MSITVNVKPGLAERLRAQAQAHGVSVETYVQSAIERLANDVDGASSTLALLDAWDEQDRTDNAAELDARRREWDELKRALDANRVSERKLFG